MLRWIMDRMVERAVPPDVEDPAQERIAEEAAENAIRQIGAVSGIAGFLVFAALAALLYGFLPSRQTVHGVAAPSEVASRVETDDARLRQATEESEGRLHQVVMERDTLQGKVAELEQRLSELPKQQPQGASAAPASEDSAERNRLQRKVGDLERQVADLAKQLQPARAATAERSAQVSKPVGPSQAPVSAGRQAAYRCGDGRIVRNPATCNAAATAPPQAVPSAPGTYHCGDGRSVPNPADCRAAAARPPQG